MTRAPGLQVVVVGGGVLGVCSAVQLARAGCRVVLVTEGELHSQASGRSLSWLNSAAIRSESYHRLRLVGIDRYRTLAAQHPGLNWLRFDGGLRWRTEDQAEELRRDHEHAVAVGYESHLVAPAEVAVLAPAVDVGAVPASGALWNPGEGWVHLPDLIAHLVTELRSRGGKVLTGLGQVRVVVAGSAVTGVRTEGGELLAAERVLLATGAGVPAAAAELGVSIPDATPLAFSLRTEPLPHGLTAVLNTPRASLRPAPGGGLVVDSDWTVADITTGPDGGYAVPPGTVAGLLAEASQVLRGHPELAVAATGLGPKPIPGDGLPVLGALAPVEGLFVAFTHSGATLGLIAGELLAYEILRGEPHPLLAGFGPQRFAGLG